MKNELDSHKVLQAFEHLKIHGEAKQDDKLGTVYWYQGLKGYSDFDGYTLFMEDAKVKLNYGFHNQYHLDYPSEADKDAFIRRLEDLYQLPNRK